MVDRGVEPAVSAYDSMILGLSEQGNVAEGMQWLGTMLKSRLKPQKKTFERLVQCLSEADMLSDALFVLDYMLKMGFVGCYDGDNGLAAVGKSCTQFDDLNLQFCKGLTNTGLVQLALGCGRTLKSLEVAASAEITDVSLEA
ncbi:Uncharacterized protein Adt_22063 [Abeliophyllum distichum]|uniref:Pentatricopeptide repeat-containing protein n=1 Tax=Abeliophyllum distichum TaxID=126358 RepID=A0ABD1T145_9LAMI